MNYTRFLFVAFLAASACGGIDENKKVSELSAEDRKALCEEGLASQGTAPKMCSNGVTFTPRTQAECEAGSGSNCTVKQVRACDDSIGGDICNFFTTAECAAVAACSQ